MNENFKKLIGLLELKDIKLIDSHETVLSYPIQDDKEISIHGEQLFPKDDPKNTDDVLIFRPKYVFSFSIEDTVFYKCEYIFLVSFSYKDLSKIQKLLEDKETKDLFFDKQINRTLWSIVRGVVMDGFNKHSLKPIILPWIK
ncbi:MAG: hypothetical protein MR494_03685 [Spirochaetia bacterium]|nr:hypothetical protein [Spirochaetia bacterium]